MALINCPECGKEISNQTEKCIHCGYPLGSGKKETKKKEQRKKHNFRFTPKSLYTVLAVITVILICIIIYFTGFTKSAMYKKANMAYDNEHYQKAVFYYSAVGDYEDAATRLVNARNKFYYFEAQKKYEKGQWKEAKDLLGNCVDFTMAYTLSNDCDLNIATSLMGEGNYHDAESILKEIVNYAGSRDKWRECEYLLGVELQNSGDYSGAAERFRSSSNYKDSIDRLIAIGSDYVEKGEYKKALEIYGSIKEKKLISDSHYIYAYAQTNLEDKNYEEAIAYLEQITSFKDSDELLKQAYYTYALNLFNKKEYDESKTILNKIVDYKDSSELIQGCDLMKVQDLLNEGKLHAAKNAIEELDEALVYKEYSTKGYKELLEKNSKWVDLSGLWTSTSGQMRVTQSGSYYNYWWYYDFKEGDRELEVKCFLKKDGKVNVSINGYLDYYTEYSSLAEYVKQEKVPINISEEMSELGTIKIDDYTSISLSNSKITIDYNRTDRSQDVYFKYIYKTNVTYGKRVFDY